MGEPVQVIDLFAGPGGLGEGFASFRDKGGRKPFKLAISIEKDKFAYRTLRLRSFLRQFEEPPEEYYDYVRGRLNLDQLYEELPGEAEKSEREVWQAELGEDDFPHEKVKEEIEDRLKDRDCILIGGPPCQAYSLAGRSRMRVRGDDFNQDPRHTLYKEYLKILKAFAPKVFVMENVKGILSSRLDGKLVFDLILKDFRELSNPGYRLYSLVTGEEIMRGGGGIMVVSPSSVRTMVFPSVGIGSSSLAS